MAYGGFRRVFNAGLLILAVQTAALAGESLKLIAFGDSLTAGYGLAAEDSFAAQLGRALQAKGRDVEVVNAGVSGDTTTGGLARLDWTLAERPDAIIVELGANDALRGIDPAVTKANLDEILKRLTERDVAVLLAGMQAPPNLGSEYGAQFNGLYSELAEKHGVALYPFFLDGVAAQQDLNQYDGIHPNADGIAVIVERLTPYVLDLLDQIETVRK